ncbi:unnamed protein product, partial [Porites evermanni]
DIDECSTAGSCDVNATCNNTHGSYNCTCKKGYYGDGHRCTGNRKRHCFGLVAHTPTGIFLNQVLLRIRWSKEYRRDRVAASRDSLLWTPGDNYLQKSRKKHRCQLIEDFGLFNTLSPR